jgi:outer membrane protein TolC
MRLSDVPPFTVTLPISLGPGIPNSFALAPTVLNNYNIRTTFQEPLFTGFRLDASKDMADYSMEAASKDYAKDRVDLTYNVKNAYWALYKAIEAKKVFDENVGLFEAHVKEVQTQMEQGLATYNDVLKVQVQLSDAQLRQIDARNAVRLAVLGLDNVIGLPLSTEVTPATQIEFQPKQYPDLEVLMNKATASRPDLKAMESRVKAGEAAVSAARSGWFPQIYLVGNYYYSRPNTRIFPTIDAFKDSWDVGLSVSLDIWNWGTTLHQTDQAQAQLAQTKDILSQMQDGIALEISQTYLNLTQAKERIGVARKTVEQAEENYRITDDRFKEGLSLNTDLIDAEFSLTQAKLNYTQALVDYRLAEARLEKALGD